MQPISANYQIKAALFPTLKGHIDSFIVLLKCLDGIAKEVFHLILCSLVEGLYQIAPHDLNPETIKVKRLT
jgi:hypothetical protein